MRLFQIFFISLSLMISSCQIKGEKKKDEIKEDSITVIATPIFDGKIEGDKMAYVKRITDKRFAKGFPDAHIITTIRDSQLVFKLVKDYPYFKNIKSILTAQGKLHFYIGSKLNSEQKNKLSKFFANSPFKSFWTEGDSDYTAGEYLEKDQEEIDKLIQSKIKTDESFSNKLFLWSFDPWYVGNIDQAGERPLYYGLVVCDKNSAEFEKLDNGCIDSVESMHHEKEAYLKVFLNRQNAPILEKLINSGIGGILIVATDQNVVWCRKIHHKYSGEKNAYDFPVIDKVQLMNLESALQYDRASFWFQLEVKN